MYFKNYKQSNYLMKANSGEIMKEFKKQVKN